MTLLSWLGGRRVAQHRKDLFAQALVVARVRPAERAAEQVAVDVDRPGVPVCPRHADDDDVLAVHCLDRRIGVLHEAGRHLVVGKRRIPEIVQDLVGLLYADDVEHARLRLLGAQDDDATGCVGESGKRLPDAARQSTAAVTPLRRLHLQAVAFLELSELAKVQFANPFSTSFCSILSPLSVAVTFTTNP